MADHDSHGIDWTGAFDNSAYVPGSGALLERWIADAAAYRERLTAQGKADLDLSYGPAARNHLDLFHPGGATRGLVVFIHGGYWQMLDKSAFSHLAQGARAHGWAVAIPSYTLAPDARIAEITREVGEAIASAARRVDGPLRLVGHSAGGHLAARMACDGGPLAGTVAARLARVVPVSGLHDLRPLMLSDMNATLRLDAAEAAAESPALQTPRPDLPVSFWVGARERPELMRQTRLAAEAWAARSDRIAETYQPGEDHFSVIAALADPGSALLAELLR